MPRKRIAKPKGGYISGINLKAERGALLAFCKEVSPDLNKLQKIEIDDRTWIYVSKRKDPVKAKARWLAALKESKANPRLKD